MSCDPLRPARASDVAVACGPLEYDAVAPFSPDEPFPEYARALGGVLSARNAVYRTVRSALHLLGLDDSRYGTPEWNPLAGWVHPGDSVVLKPNFVREFRESSSDHANCLITHGALIRALVDYVFIALRGRGRIVIADAPHSDADFDAIRRITCVDSIAAFYRETAGFPVEIYDLRPEAAVKIDGVIVSHRPLSGDPAGYAVVDLGSHSMFQELGDLCRLLYGAEYDRSELVRHHSGGHHEYLISKTVLQADCVISLPKLKTHKKTGVTVNMKNLVGINGNKNWLPHHREGTPAQGGDQFADSGLGQRTERAVVAAFKRCFPLLGPLRPALAGPVKSVGRAIFGDTNRGTVRSGNWYGNDTAWRMAIDLNRVLLYADAEGCLHGTPVRRFFSVVDGIIGGEGNGPLDPRPRPAGVVLAGANPVAVDAVAARLIGFDPRKLPIVLRAFDASSLPLASFAPGEIDVRSNVPAFGGPLSALTGSPLRFEAHFGWKGHVEVAEATDEVGALA
jgi:uncharacterized protein (DUF362 family)